MPKQVIPNEVFQKEVWTITAVVFDFENTKYLFYVQFSLSIHSLDLSQQIFVRFPIQRSINRHELNRIS